MLEKGRLYFEALKKKTTGSKPKPPHTVQELQRTSAEFYGASRKLDTLADQVGRIEGELDVENGKRWDLEDEKVKIVMERQSKKEFKEAKRKVQVLSIARVLEFEKAGLSDTCKSYISSQRV